MEKTEQLPHNEGFIISEAPGTLSREQVVIAADVAAIEAGTVMSKRDDGLYEPLDPSSTEGSTEAVGILCSRVDPSDGAGGVGVNVNGVIIERLAEVRASDLLWSPTITTAQQDTAEAELLALNIKIRVGSSIVSTQTT